MATLTTGAWGLRRKILLGYGMVLCLLLLVFAWAVHNLLRLGQASEAILSENYRSIIAAENMIDALERQDSGVLLYILGFEAEGTEQFQENERKFLQWFSRAGDNITIEGEADIIARIDSAYAAYLRAFTQFLQESAATGERPAMQYHEVLLPAFMAVRVASAALRDLNQHTMYGASEAARTVSHAAIWSVTAVALLATGLALAFSHILSTRLVRPVQQMRTAAMQIAEGDYDVDVPAASSDELGQLADQFNVMASRLRAYRDLNVEQIVAEKRKSEAIIRSIDDGIIAVDQDLHILDINPVAARVLRIDPGEAKGRHFLEIVGNEHLFAYVKNTLSSGRPPEIAEKEAFLSMKRGAHETHYQYAVTPVYTPAGTMLGAILLLRDVTKLKELDRLKSEFVAMASHELKTPLTSIGMSIGLLQERITERLDERERALFDVARDDVERLQNLVRDLLDLSRIEAGKIELAFEAVPVSLLFEKAVQALRLQAEERAVALSFEVDDELDVRADANKVTWVLTNLISNALRYTHAGGHIRLAAEQIGSKMHLSVADDGEGIPFEYQHKIFEKFVKGKNAKGGSGLGLAISKEIVRAHGGSIWVDSIPGEGSTFTFTLPVVS